MTGSRLQLFDDYHPRRAAACSTPRPPRRASPQEARPRVAALAAVVRAVVPPLVAAVVG